MRHLTKFTTKELLLYHFLSGRQTNDYGYPGYYYELGKLIERRCSIYYSDRRKLVEDFGNRLIRPYETSI